ncbi:MULTISPECIES: type IV pilus secretin family protein [unclassified Methylophilus]|uniref:type IV pilus secretin family protein n=2 Tax=unclassified Methylophilus TaxID=2630143 RepID=UPI0023B35947|nr:MULTISPECIES: type IV pilus secretin family protein [unclassified Methylophilus]MDF0379377.1 type IV pilus secretin PilQ [Methylophilus sp. YYY-1]MDT7848696.1 type IV pilus secretin PilQ [Methylophilus sp. VKM B-3414]
MMNTSTYNLARIILLAATMVVSTCILAAEPADGKNLLQVVEATMQPGAKLNVQLQLSQPLATTPVSFTLSNPPRVVFDLPNAVNSTGKNVIPINQGVLKSVQIAQTNDRTRIVMNLTKPVQHQLELHGLSLMVGLIQEGQEIPVATTAAKRFSEQDAGAAHKIQRIDFMRGKNGEGRVLVDLSDSRVGVNVRNAGKTVVIDFADTDLPESLQRRLNVINFNTPVLFVDALRHHHQAQIVIEPQGDWEQSAYQTDKRLVVDIRPIAKDPNKLIQGSKQGYAGEKLSLNFQRVDVRDVLKVIADFTGKNIVVSDSVSGSVTIGLKDVPWDQALDVIMKSKGLDMRVNGSVISIAPAEEFAAKEKAQLTAEAERETLETLRTEVFSLKYQKAMDFRNMLLGGGAGTGGSSSSMSSASTSSSAGRMNRILSQRGSVTFDARTNTIFVQDTPRKLEEVQAIINKVDVPVKQVIIESRMVIASNTFSKALGARFGISQTGTPGSNTNVSIGGSLGNKTTAYTAPTTAGTNGTYTLGTQGGTVQSATIGDYIVSSNGQPDLMSNLPVTNAYGGIALSLLKLSANLLLNLELSALEADSRGKVISSPRVTTANQQKARIAQGVEIPYQTATSSGATAVSFKKAELSLEVTPQITPDQKIIMDLDVRKDSKGEETSGGVAINTQNVQTQVLVGNGETVVLGGIYEQVSRKSTDKVPFFGDLPVVGYAFKRNTRQEDKTELLIFITPKVMDETLALN